MLPFHLRTPKTFMGCERLWGVKVEGNAGLNPFIAQIIGQCESWTSYLDINLLIFESVHGQLHLDNVNDWANTLTFNIHEALEFWSFKIAR